MKKEELQEIRERVDNATNRGTWKAEENGLVHVPGLGVICRCDLARFEPSTFNNAEFIAHAREDVPKLLDEIERLHQVFRDILSNIHNPYKTVNQSLSEIDEIAHSIFRGDES